MPVGQNDALTWPDLTGLYRRRNRRQAQRYIRMLARHGVTCLRMMLEYAETEHRYFEEPVGRFNPTLVEFWDDLFSLCERYGLRVLLTPFDTFWMWNRWDRHPYSRRRGGPCPGPAELLTSCETRQSVKARFDFAIRRWGGSGALFAWDLWNEIHPAQAGNSAEVFDSFIRDLSTFVRDTETALYGRSHPQTVSIFYPHVVLDARRIPEAIFRHPCLDFASTHFYDEGTIDDPRNTVDAAVAAGRLVRDALAQIRDQRPFFDSEHGPIHTFKDHLQTLPADFDTEYFRHFQWAHFASGGAGGGMRWPNRRPHQLVLGMRHAQRSLTRFLPSIDWISFHRQNCSAEVSVSSPNVVPFCCADSRQAILWLLRNDSIGPDGRLDQNAAPLSLDVALPGMDPGAYRVVAWDTEAGSECAAWDCRHSGGRFAFTAPPFRTDLAFAIRQKSRS
jgi:mannan endo-1,4-beta-mannosidase